MTIAGLVKFSTVDYPGMLSAVVFTAGCSWNCWFCHNRDVIDAGQTIDLVQVRRFLRARAGVLDGVVVSGGEPTLHDDLPEFLRELQDMGYKTKLDTNGSCPAVVERILGSGLADYVAVDLKAPPGRYRDVGAGDASTVRETISMLRAAKAAFEVRTTVTPDIDAAALREMCRFAGEVPLYALQLYRPGRPCGAVGPACADLEKLREAILDIQPHVIVRA